MTAKLSNQVRIEQTLQEHEYLQKEIEEWFNHRRLKDKLQQYYTQLNSLETILTSSLKALRENLDGLAQGSATNSVGQFYDECRKHEKRLLWVRRVWTYFRSKFDQRDDTRLEQVLAVADEVVWSCYAQVFRSIGFNAPEGVEQGSVPLPYIDPYYSPKAIPRTNRPPDLNSEIDSEFLQDYLNLLPIPVVSLPPNCVRAPWWLICLGHEVGHHVQYDLLPEWQLVGIFGDLLKSVVLNEYQLTDKERSAQTWKNWGQEIFADAFSVLTMGTSSVWAITELELADEQQMLTRKPLYPSPVVRLALMAHLADSLGMNSQPALHGLNPQAMVVGDSSINDVESRNLRQTAAADLTQVPQIVTAILGLPLANLGQFKQLCGWNNDDFSPYGKVYNWTQALSGRTALHPEESLNAPRLIVSGAVDAWAEVAAIGDAKERADKQLDLKARILEVVPQSREMGTREGASLPKQNLAVLGDKLVQQLLEANSEELGI